MNDYGIVAIGHLSGGVGQQPVLPEPWNSAIPAIAGLLILATLLTQCLREKGMQA